jgi:phospholipase C
VSDPLGLRPAKMDGFVRTAAHDARFLPPPYFDVDGKRAMGYYTGKDLNYYYFMASNFATSDRGFTRSQTSTHDLPQQKRQDRRAPLTTQVTCPQLADTG